MARAQRVADSIRERLLGDKPANAAGRAMECGCGTGLVGLELSASLGEVVLVDSSPGMIQTVQAKLDSLQDPSIKAVVADLSADLSGGAQQSWEADFDIVFSVLAFHHIKNTRQTLENLRALLVREGKLFIVDMDADGGRFHADFENFEGHHGFDRDWLIRKVEASGFEV